MIKNMKPVTGILFMGSLVAGTSTHTHGGYNNKKTFTRHNLFIDGSCSCSTSHVQYSIRYKGHYFRDW